MLSCSSLICIIWGLFVGLLALWLFWTPEKFPKGPRLVTSLLALAVFTGVSSGLVFLNSYAAFICNEAMFFLWPFDLFVGLPLFIALLVFVLRKRLVYPPFFAIVPIALFFSWAYLARPNGIWVERHKAAAYSSLFVPADVSSITRQGPQPDRGAVFHVEFFSELTIEELTAFYLSKISSNGFELLSSAAEASLGPSAFQVRHTIYYRNRTGQKCSVRISDHPPNRDASRCVWLDCYFDGPLFNPGPSSFA